MRHFQARGGKFCVNLGGFDAEIDKGRCLEGANHTDEFFCLVDFCAKDAVVDIYNVQHQPLQ